jgi:hypothetical protein
MRMSSFKASSGVDRTFDRAQLCGQLVVELGDVDLVEELAQVPLVVLGSGVDKPLLVVRRLAAKRGDWKTELHETDVDTSPPHRLHQQLQ